VGKAKAQPARRKTPAERAAQIAAHPNTDTRPRYADGGLAMSEDRVLHQGAEARLLWTNLSQEVPRRTWDAVLDGLGTVPLSDLRLIRRGP
jgi:hypothetical protein